MDAAYLFRVALCFALSALFVACRPAAPEASPDLRRAGEPLTVAAAASLKDAFGEIGRLYEERTGARVNFSFAASGVLQRQIEGGAPVDVFASAGERQMNEVAARGLIDDATRRDFARNALVLIVRRDSTLALNSFATLAAAPVQRIAVGNPKTVPAGQYTEQSFTKLNLLPSLQPRLVFAEDVRQVLDYVRRGETDAGVVYASDVRAASDEVRIAARAPEESHDPIRYPLAVIKDSRNAEVARGFIELVTSADGQAILRKHNFLTAHGR